MALPSRFYEDFSSVMHLLFLISPCSSLRSPLSSIACFSDQDPGGPLCQSAFGWHASFSASKVVSQSVDINVQIPCSVPLAGSI